MSLRATLWALDHAPVDDPRSLLVVIALADEADDAGRGAGIGVKVLAERARCSQRTVQRRLADLLAAGIITLGDQRKVAHIQANYRPTVYDLSMHLTRGDSVTPLPPNWDDSSVTPDPPRGDNRGDSRGDTADDSPVVPKSRSAACSAREFSADPGEPACMPAGDHSPDQPTNGSPLTVSDYPPDVAALRRDLDQALGRGTSWRSLTESECTEISSLIATHSPRALIDRATHQARSIGSPPRHVRAWLIEWRDLIAPAAPEPPAARLRSVPEAEGHRVGPGQLRALIREQHTGGAA